MTIALVALLALSWTGLSLAVLAMAFKRISPPRQAAWRAWGISIVFNGISAWYAAPGEPLPTTILVLLCHVLLLPPLLLAARWEERRP
ncbi:hypothetical protein [Paracraurococcus lichenis]|uniref:Uncharacterized protein n=1 Tax=Paracraurococcus lichenis TaxID=3064888 RepID=A0ABT9DTY1_9PROT|nr:hypothetical protein [Paracraurococcus sp. LOR1-02]MDO9707363.1 hypothetical protein [Paracraurococcus sp. LOR1-02]